MTEEPTYSELEAALRDRISSLREDVADKIIESGFLPGRDLAEKVCDCDFMNAALVDPAINNGGWALFLSKMRELALSGIFLEKKIISNLASEDLPFFSEVGAEDRFELLAPLGEIASQEIQRFAFRVPYEPEGPFMDIETFVVEHFLLARENGLHALDLHEAQILRRGIVKYFDKLVPLTLTNEFDEADSEKTLDFLAEFIVYFSEAEIFGNEPFLDLKMTKSLQETLSFLQYLGEGEDLDNYTLAAISVAEPYLKNIRKSQDTKYPNHPDRPEKATPFEHFMSVTRITLGAVESLDLNSRLLGNDFNEKLKSRPNYLLEIAYTALLHDIVEDGKATMKEVEVLLAYSELDPLLIEQILKNVVLLNVKGTNNYEAYVDSILGSDNPVVLLIKYGDIVHNNKSFTKKKFDKDGNLSDFWQEKQKAYSRIVESVVVGLPVHVRVKELIDILSANPELLQFEVWKNLLIHHPKRDEVFSALPGFAKKYVGEVLVQ